MRLYAALSNTMSRLRHISCLFWTN